jgi:hypothetical protein
MKHTTKREIILVFSIVLFLVSSFGCLNATAQYTVGSKSLSLTSTAANPFQICAVQGTYDRNNIQVTGSKPANVYAFNEQFGLQAAGQSITDVNYPLTMTTPASGLNVYNPASQVQWLGIVNSTSALGSYSVNVAQLHETMSVGSTLQVTLNNSLNILNVDVGLTADTAYLLLATNLLGNFVTNPNTALTVLDPTGNTWTPVGPYLAYTTSTSTYYYIIVPKVSGTHLLSFYYNIGAALTAVNLDLRSIPTTGITPGSFTVAGDDLSTASYQTAINKHYTYLCFSMDVSLGDVYTLYMKYDYINFVSGEQTRIFAAIPSLMGYQVGQVALSTSVSTNGGIAAASGKVMLIAVEEYIPAVYSFGILMQKPQSISQSTPSTVHYDIQPYTFQAIRIHVDSTSILRINASIDTGATLSISGLYMPIQNSALGLLSKFYSLDITSTTPGDFDRFYLLQSSDYYLLLNNIADSNVGKINVTTRIYMNNNMTTITPWMDTFNSATNTWAGFNDSSNFQSLTFTDAGKATGAKIAQAFQFTVGGLTFMDLRTQLQPSLNAPLNSADLWNGNVSYIVFGPNGYYASYPFITLDGAGSASWTFNNASISSARTYQSPVMTFRTPGQYYLFMTLNNWRNTTAPSSPFTGNITLSAKLMDLNNYFLWSNYSVSKQPMYHAYAKTYLKPGSLDFSKTFNAPSYYDNQLTNFNGAQYKYGVIYNVTNAKAYNWTQLIAYYSNMTNLQSTAISTITESETSGISIIYDGFWNPGGGVSFYNDRIGFQSGSYQGQINATSTTGAYSMEFGVFAPSFYLWILPNQYTIGNANLHQTLCIELTQYNTPTLSFKGSLSTGVALLPAWALYTIIGVVAAVAVFVVLFALYKKGKLHRY